MVSPSLTLIVPTYRRPNDLLRCLESVQRQSLDEFELLVVDNAADPVVARMVSDFNLHARIAAQYVAEPRLGLHNARHAGVRAATGDVLVFTDDDATFHVDWLAGYARSFQQNPEMVAAGGPVKPVWEAPPPRWIVEYMRTQPAMFPILSLMDLGGSMRISPDEVFFGVNMAIRRQTVLEMGGFNPDSFGSVWLGDGETGLNRKLQREGLLIGYLPNALVYHHIPPERLTLAYFIRREQNDGACDVYGRFHEAGLPARPELMVIMTQLAIASLRDFTAAVVLRGRTDPRSLRVQLRAYRAAARLTYIWRLLRSGALRQLVTRRNWLYDPVAIDVTP
jgi:glucosyl-dolichyl phosphate glucuronosyltransferase